MELTVQEHNTLALARRELMHKDIKINLLKYQAMSSEFSFYEKHSTMSELHQDLVFNLKISEEFLFGLRDASSAPPVRVLLQSERNYYLRTNNTDYLMGKAYHSYLLALIDDLEAEEGVVLSSYISDIVNTEFYLVRDN